MTKSKFTIFLRPDQIQKVKIEAAIQGCSRSEVISRFVDSLPVRFDSGPPGKVRAEELLVDEDKPEDPSVIYHFSNMIGDADL